MTDKPDSEKNRGSSEARVPTMQELLQELLAALAKAKEAIPDFKEKEARAWLDFAQGITIAAQVRLRKITADDTHEKERYAATFSRERQINTAAKAQEVLRKAGFATGDTARSLADHALHAIEDPKTGAHLHYGRIDPESVISFKEVCWNCLGTGMVYDKVCPTCERPDALALSPEQKAIATRTDIPRENPTVVYYSDKVAPEVIKSVLDKQGPVHFAHPGTPGPHLLRDRKGNTAYCGGPGTCEFCERGVPATGDHQAVDVDAIEIIIPSDPIPALPWDGVKGLDRLKEIANCPDCQACQRHAYSDATTPGFFYTECEKHRQPGIQGAAGVVIETEMSLEEAKRRFPCIESKLDGRLKINTDGPATTIIGKDIPKETVSRIHDRIFPGWSPERLKELADAESAALDATGGLLAVSPELLAEMIQDADGDIKRVSEHFAKHTPEEIIAQAESIKNDNTSPASPTPEMYALMQRPVSINIPDRWPWDGYGEKPHETIMEKWDEERTRTEGKTATEGHEGFAESKSGDSETGVQRGDQSSGEDANRAEVAGSGGGREQADQAKINALKKIPGVTTATEMIPAPRVACALCGGVYGRHLKGCTEKK